MTINLPSGYKPIAFSADCAACSKVLRQSNTADSPLIVYLFGMEITADGRTVKLSERERRQWLKGK